MFLCPIHGASAQPESLLNSAADAAARKPQHAPPRTGETEAAQPPARSGTAATPLPGGPGDPGKASPCREGDSYLEELDSLPQELQCHTPGEAAGGFWGREARVSLRSGGDALRARCAPLLLPASCPQVPPGGGRGGSGWVAESRLAEGRAAARCPEPLAPASDAGRRARGERDLERRGARPQLLEPPLERLGGRWAGGRAWRVVTHT